MYYSVITITINDKNECPIVSKCEEEALSNYEKICEQFKFEHKESSSVCEKTLTHYGHLNHKETIINKHDENADIQKIVITLWNDIYYEEEKKV